MGKEMKMQMGVVAVLLWVVTVAGAGWFFVKGWTVKGTDGRMEISLAPSERDLILGEMRQLLKAVHGVVTGVAGQDQAADRQQIEQAARAAGMGMAVDVNPAIMAKLPLSFKQQRLQQLLGSHNLQHEDLYLGLMHMLDFIAGLSDHHALTLSQSLQGMQNAAGS